jgi:hypothetical protein
MNLIFSKKEFNVGDTVYLTNYRTWFDPVHAEVIEILPNGIPDCPWRVLYKARISGGDYTDIIDTYGSINVLMSRTNSSYLRLGFEGLKHVIYKLFMAKSSSFRWGVVLGFILGSLI